MNFTDRERRSFSLSRAIAQAGNAGLTDGIEAELLRAYNEEAGAIYSPKICPILYSIVSESVARSLNPCR
jgi:hypothetical protein